MNKRTWHVTFDLVGFIVGCFLVYLAAFFFTHLTPIWDTLARLVGS